MPPRRGTHDGPPSFGSTDDVPPEPVPRGPDRHLQNAHDRWARLEYLYHRTAGLDSTSAARLLKRECGGDQHLLQEAISLLEHAPRSAGFLDRMAKRILAVDSTGESRASAALREASAPLMGTIAERYEVSERLGHGSMSFVYQALDRRLQREVVIKLLPALSSGSKARQRFLVEARAAAAFNHENICRVYDMGETEDHRPFIVMELCRGETLDDILRRASLELIVALDYAVQACRGLTHAHGAGIIHRDVKPANLFITDAGILKLLDFGLAKLEDVDLTSAHRVMGTVKYMSPEQTVGDRLDARTDVWSLGVVLYEMLTGRRPFEGRSAAAVFQAIQHSDPVPPSELNAAVPKALGEVLLGALEKHRERRTRSVLALMTRLHDVC